MFIYVDDKKSAGWKAASGFKIFYTKQNHETFGIFVRKAVQIKELR